MYETQLRDDVSQGDILDSIPISYVAAHPDTGQPLTEIRLVRAMMLTHDCEYDKPQNGWVIVAEIRPLSEIEESNRGHIRRNKVYNTFYLSTGEVVTEESFVDLRRIDRIHKRLFGQGERVASLKEDARLALQRQIAVYFGLDRTAR